jgi:uncharacterized membrane protein
MTKARLEAFSDGVFAVIITIMVLEMKAPSHVTFAALHEVLPIFLSYVLSFIYVGIYWTNHHHLLHAAQKVNGSILWANLHLLFWLSLIPFGTAWMGENPLAPASVALYGFILMCAGFAYYILTKRLIHHHGRNSALAVNIGKDRKSLLSACSYAIALPIAFFWPPLSCAIYVLVALIWLVPDPRIERHIDA